MRYWPAPGDGSRAHRDGVAPGTSFWDNLGVKARSRLAVARAEHSRLAAAGVRVLREPVAEPWDLLEM
jgi:hypothetical protein